MRQNEENSVARDCVALVMEMETCSDGDENSSQFAMMASELEAEALAEISNLHSLVYGKNLRERKIRSAVAFFTIIFVFVTNVKYRK